MNAQIGRVQVPVFAVLTAVVPALKAAGAHLREAHAAASPGGEKVTAGEVLEAVGIFAAKLVEGALPAVLKANGVALPAGESLSF